MVAGERCRKSGRMSVYNIYDASGVFVYSIWCPIYRLNKNDNKERGSWRQVCAVLAPLIIILYYFLLFPPFRPLSSFSSVTGLCHPLQSQAMHMPVIPLSGLEPGKTCEHENGEMLILHLNTYIRTYYTFQTSYKCRTSVYMYSVTTLL